MSAIVYREAGAHEIPAVSALVLRVHASHIAPLEPESGRETFARYADADAMAARASNHRLWVAEADGALVGMLEVRDETHVALLFVDPTLHRAGVGRGLMTAAFGPEADWPPLTVNSTPGAIPAYERLGFTIAEPARDSNGMRFVPMRRESTGA